MLYGCCFSSLSYLISHFLPWLSLCNLFRLYIFFFVILVFSSFSPRFIILSCISYPCIYSLQFLGCRFSSSCLVFRRTVLSLPLNPCCVVDLWWGFVSMLNLCVFRLSLHSGELNSLTVDYSCVQSICMWMECMYVVKSGDSVCGVSQWTFLWLKNWSELIECLINAGAFLYVRGVCFTKSSFKCVRNRKKSLQYILKFDLTYYNCKICFIFYLFYILFLPFFSDSQS